MKIKNWNKFQHFKDRRPPWVKLHREILEQRDIGLLSDRCFRVLVGLWLIASEDESLEGNLPQVEDIAFKLRMEKAQVIKCLESLSPFLIQDDIIAISGQCQVDEPEKRREETEKRQSRRKIFLIPSIDDVKRYCKERNNSVDPEKFIDHYTSNGWLVGKNKMKDWKAAVRTWEKNNGINSGHNRQSRNEKPRTFDGGGHVYDENFRHRIDDK